ncbi:MAG: hypothetical protein CVV64_10730 [Candidatus Wallbacteria bacterium HGW-Wallbacteria-1]|jgi:PAS domain S-box-containing protein|uniref:histidine kinase n=1 Tax=Candidatus Wallbacteria bacterium HGW-Wallbacteria-1 TaxID=2013854 RepID=A0A2N1PPD4_9BACT|nr:MAG: hypothetical protein CVV64_10730 [Candidatus Wallbacteria bacterium HGW-Wallbacteria-1]
MVGMNREETTIGSRLTRYIVIIAFIVTLAALGLLIMFRYEIEVQSIVRSAESVRKIYCPQIAQAIWDYSDETVKSQIESLRGLKYLVWVQLKTDGRSVKTGTHPLDGEAVIIRKYDISHPLWGNLGSLEIIFSLREVRRAVLLGAAGNFGLIILPFGVLALSTLLLFRRLVTRHLDALADYSREMTLDTLNRNFSFQRSCFERRHDELDRLLESFDFMRENLSREISSRIQAEQKLRETENIYRQIFNATGDAIFLHDSNTFEIVDVNDTMLEMYGCSSRDEIIGKTTSLTTEEAIDRLKAARDGVPQLFEWLATRRNGEQFWVEVSLRTMEPLVKGRILAAVRDISRRKEAETEVLQYQKMESLGRIVGGIAHDFNNLLAGIIPPAEIISLDAAEPEHVDLAETIVTTGRRAAELTERLLAFTRKSVIVTRTVDIHTIINDSVAMLERSLDPRIKLKVELCAEKHICNGDPGQLVNSLLNLELNARDAMMDGGELVISTSNHYLDRESCLKSPFNPEAGEYIRISVTDSGTGMSNDVISKAMEPFFTTKSPGRGTGLGLPSVYRTAMDHGGLISIESTLNMGTEVHFSLPVDKNCTHLPVMSEKVRILEKGRNRGRILVIDDDKAARKSSEAILTRSGYEVVTAENGLDGLEKVKLDGQKFDLVILDMIMPVMNGPETLVEIRKICSDQRIIIVSGCARNHDVDTMLSEDIQGYLKKPFGVSELGRAVADALKE